MDGGSHSRIWQVSTKLIINNFLFLLLRLADRAKDAGVDVTLEVWNDMPHVFHNYYNEIPESKQAIEKIGKYIQMILT